MLTGALCSSATANSTALCVCVCMCAVSCHVWSIVSWQDKTRESKMYRCALALTYLVTRYIWALELEHIWHNLVLVPCNILWHEVVFSGYMHSTDIAIMLWKHTVITSDHWFTTQWITVSTMLLTYTNKFNSKELGDIDIVDSLSLPL